MKKIKLVSVMAILFLLTGCTADYTLTIDKNLNFTEEVNISENNFFFTSGGTTPEEYISSKKSIYEQDDVYRKFDYNTKINSDTTTLNAKRKKMDINTFNNESIVYDSLYGAIYAEKQGNQLKVHTTDYDPNLFAESMLPLDPKYEKLTFTLKTPLKMIQNNADISNEELGTYTWNFNKNTTPKNIEFVLDTKLSTTEQLIEFIKRFWYIPCIIIVLIIGFLKISISFKQNNKI